MRHVAYHFHTTFRTALLNGKYVSPQCCCFSSTPSLPVLMWMTIVRSFSFTLLKTPGYRSKVLHRLSSTVKTRDVHWSRQTSRWLNKRTKQFTYCSLCFRCLCWCFWNTLTWTTVNESSSATRSGSKRKSLTNKNRQYDSSRKWPAHPVPPLYEKGHGEWLGKYRKRSFPSEGPACVLGMPTQPSQWRTG